MNKVKVVTAYVPLTVQNMKPESFHELGSRLACACGDRIRVFRDFPYNECWLAREIPPGVSPANPRALDRFATEEEHLRSNVVQHSPVQWVSLAAAEDPEPDVFVWMGYSLLKQGDFTGKRITEAHVVNFLRAVERYPFTDLPFPGIASFGPISVFGDNWRFCGSTVIMPRKFLDMIVKSYKFHMRSFLLAHRKVPLDLAIWPMVEQRSGLPWRFYPAEYDYTQLTNFPG